MDMPGAFEKKNNRKKESQQLFFRSFKGQRGHAWCVGKKKEGKEKEKDKKSHLVVCCCSVTEVLGDVCLASACVIIRHHTSAYVSIRQLGDVRLASAYVSIRQHTSAYFTACLVGIGDSLF